MVTEAFISQAGLLDRTTYRQRHETNAGRHARLVVNNASVVI